ncbi:MAG: hypothetical protein KAQ87_04405 [Candidatus Pacebacteria bacterium]|nr:hypothetical protein [Candidatus Paceibacterota bacterium]
MKKESLQTTTVKTLLAVLLFAGMGTIIIGGGYIIGEYGKNRINNQITKPVNQEENYYDVLEKKCDGDGCCLASLKVMRENNYKEADKNGNCPEGFNRNMMRCIISYQWCEPIKKNSAKDEIEKIALCEKIIYKNSKDRCYCDYAMSKNNRSLCGHIIDNTIKEDCYNNLSEKNRMDPPVLWALGSEPDAIPIADTTDVLFTTMQTGLEDKANKIIVEELDESGIIIRILGDLNDDETNGDLVANDYIYSGTFRISSSKEGSLFFRAKADFSNISDLVYTDRYKFGVTRFPIGLYSSNMSKVITNSKTGEKMISNEVIVSFTKGASPDTIENIIEAINAEIIGTIFGLGVYQVRISDTGDATGVNETIDKLLNYPEVKYAEPNYIVEMDQI